MKTRFTIVLAIGLWYAVPARAQEMTAVKGMVRDELNRPLEAVTVSLLRAGDSSLVKAAITDTSGLFEIEREACGRFLLSYTSMGYARAFSAPFLLEAGKGFTVPALQLQPERRKIADVVITSRKPMIEVKPGKVVFNVEGSINATGSNALELLQKSPGVQVSNDESIRMKGKAGVKVYIDGKMMQLDEKALADYLKSISSSDVELIEMIANPGAGYDASGNAGVINIKLKKNKKYGANGSIELGVQKGIWYRGNGALGLNYRNRKVNVFSNVSGNIGNRENELNLYRIQNGSIFDQETTMFNKRRNVHIKAGADYFLDRKHTVGVLATSGFSGGTFTTESATDIYSQATGALQQKLKAGNEAQMNRASGNFNVNYRYADDSTGKQVSFDADYGLYHNRIASYQPNNYYGAADDFQYTIINGNRTPTDIRIYTAKLDAEHKLWKGKLGYGLKSALVKTDNSFDFFKYTDNVAVRDLAKSNSFAYSENVNAAYLSYDISPGKKWSLQAGLRMEQTHSKGELLRADGGTQSDNTVERDYLDLFPNATLNYTIMPDHVLELNYNRRINRPDYQDLNPFENKLDEMTYEKGNAFLKPEYADNITLSYVFKSAVNLSVGYSHVKDYAVMITDTINTRATFIQRQNIAAQKIYSVSLGAPLPIAKWWNGYVSLWYNYQEVRGSFNHIHIDLSAPGYGAYMQSTFTLGRGCSAEISGWFDGKGVEGTWEKNAMGSLDAGLQKKFLQDRASVKITATDILRTTRFRGGSNYGGTDMRINQQNENRTIRLNFSYRFGSSQIKAARQRKTASDSEGSRIK